MGRSKVNKRHTPEGQKYLFNHGRKGVGNIPTRDQQQSPPSDAYLVVNLLLAFIVVVIGGALLSLRYK